MKVTLGRAILIVLRRELQHEFRSRQRLLMVLLYAALSTFVFSFALELDRGARQEAVAGVLWTTIVFASLLGFERQSGEARGSGMREALRLAPIPRHSILIGQLLANWLFTLSLAILTLLVQSWLFDMPLLQAQVIAAVVMGSLGIATIGTMLSAMISQTRASAGILGMLMLPLILPTVISAVRLTLVARVGRPGDADWLLLLVLQDLILILLATWLYPYLVDG